MALKAVSVLITKALILHFCINAIVCDINSGTRCQGTECPWEELEQETTCINSRVLQNLTAIWASVLQHQHIRVTHDYHQNCSCGCSSGEDTSNNEGSAVDQQSTYAGDCSDILAKDPNSTNGLYQIKPKVIPVAPSDVETEPITVYCDMETDGGGWTVFQRRFIGAVGFYRYWADYKRGFGFVNSDYWLGLETIHQITALDLYELRVDLEDFAGDHAYANYDRFHLEGEETNYKLYLGEYAGTAGDSMAYQNGKAFTTRDRDHDTYSSNCAVIGKSAWWYDGCGYSADLNSQYLGPSQDTHTGIHWLHWKDNYEVLAKTEMKIRRII